MSLQVSTHSDVEQNRVTDQIDPPSHPSRPLCQKRRVSLAAGKSGAELEPVLISQIPKALAEELVHMAQACAIVDLTMGAGTWATVALEQGLPLLRGGLDGHALPRSHGPPQGGGRHSRCAFALSAWVSELESF